MSRERDSKGKFVEGHSKVGGFKKGSKHTESSKDKIRKSLVGKFRTKSRRWKGDEASYEAFHMWLYELYGKANKCEQKGCHYPKAVDAGRRIIKQPRRYEWANISGE